MTPLPSKSTSDFKLVSNHDAHFGLPVAADEVYEPFAAWFDERLDELVGKWIHLAAPGASRRERAVRLSKHS
ncbi:MAG TPA: hypothetical protein VHC22_22810 [Pirellulales bacterium]|nr:hypothetical protein [Pirellulales bacterium]